jgi:hypothetical protein
MGRILACDTAAGTALSNTTTETTVASYAFKARELQDGSVISFTFAARATATNATDTLLFKVYLGSTAIYTCTAVDVANNDVSLITGKIVIRDADSSGTAVCVARGSDCDATGTLNPQDEVTLVSSVDFTAALTLAVKGTWSVASASNSCQSEMWLVEQLQ